MIPSWSKGIFWLTVATVAGFAGGIAFERQRAQTMSRSPMDPMNVMRVLDKSLALDSAQHATIVAVLSHRQAAIDSAWTVLQPRMKSAVDSSQTEITRVLRPDQVAKFRALMQSVHSAAKGGARKTDMP